MPAYVYQKVHEQGNYFPCTHIPAVIDCLQYNTHKASLDLDVADQISCLSP